MTPRFSITIGQPGAEPPPRFDPDPVSDRGTLLYDDTAFSWPFRREVCPAVPPAPASTIVLRDLHRAFPAGQSSGTRLCLTQPTYQLQRWLDWLERHPGITAVGNMAAAASGVAVEAHARRGPWSRIDVHAVAAAVDPYRPDGPLRARNPPLLSSFLQPDPSGRIRAATVAAAEDPTNPALQLTLASASMELQDLGRARMALERALELVPDWEAAHFEIGKLWLRAEEMERAAAAFGEATRLMPSFAAAFGNLGAVLGELERPDEALAALEHALTLDPNGYPVLNNLGAVHRDCGRLAEAETAFRSVVEIEPEFVFGHYNLGHALLLQGRFGEACAAYEAGVARDAQRNPRQALRLAVARAAAQDHLGALNDIRTVLERVPGEAGEELLAETVRLLETTLERHAGADPGVSRVLTTVARYST